MKFAEILPFTYTDLLTYSIPYNLDLKLQIGQVVEIPFGKKKTKGIVFEITKTKPKFQTKEILNIIYYEPLLTKEQVKLTKWLSLYYFSSLYQSLKNIKINELENNINTKKIPRLISSKKHREKKFILYRNNGSSLYLKIASRFLKKKKQVLILFSDNLTLERFLETNKIKSNNKKISIISSKLKQKEKNKEWHKIKNGESQLILGTRSAIFSPFLNLGLLIIDREYEDGYKQEKTPRYDTREVAEFLQGITNCVLILQTDIPTLENLYRLQNKYKIIKGKSPEKKRKINIVGEEDRFSILGIKIEKAIKENLKNKKQIILFLNRKGKNIFMACSDCGFVPKCPNCEISLIPKDNFLSCNHCGFKKQIPLTCENCKSAIIKKLGLGTEKLEEEIKTLFPNNRVIRIDKTTKKTVDDERIGKADIIIGTQMIKNVSLNRAGVLIILSIDNILNLPSYKAPSSTQKTIASIISKTAKDTEIIIKTKNPKHSLIKAVKNQDYSQFFKKELMNLKNLHYPPFYDLIQIVISAKDKKILEKETEKIKSYFIDSEVLGPFVPFMRKKSKKKRLALIIKTKKKTCFYGKIFKSKDILVTRNPENLL